jgi:hypothetical protein
MKIVARPILGDSPPIELDDLGWIVEFGDGKGMISVELRKDGKVNVVSALGYAIKVEPRAANSVWVSIHETLR